jgi:biotin carboxylase
VQRTRRPYRGGLFGGPTPIRFTAVADEEVCIGPGSVSESYLDAKRVIAAAEVTTPTRFTQVTVFLAENADFAEVCHRAI